MADERATPLNQGFDKWLQITDGGKLQTWNGVDSPAPIIGDDPLVTKTELDDKASLSEAQELYGGNRQMMPFGDVQDPDIDDRPAIVTFISDGERRELIEQAGRDADGFNGFIPLFDSKGFSIGISLSQFRGNEGDYDSPPEGVLTKQELLTLQSAGHEIMTHMPYNDPDRQVMPFTEALSYIKERKEFQKSFGFDVKNANWLQGNSNTVWRSAIRRHYKSARRVTSFDPDRFNELPINQYDLHGSRIAHGTGDGSYNKWVSVLDTVIEKRGWFVLYFHPATDSEMWNDKYDDDGNVDNTNGEWVWQKMDRFLTHITNHAEFGDNLLVKTTDEALDYYGNVIDTERGFRVSKSGLINIGEGRDLQITASSKGTRFGSEAGDGASDGFSSFFGRGAGRNSQGEFCSIFGHSAGTDQIGENCTFYGALAGNGSQADECTLSGFRAGQNNTQRLTSYGHQAGQNNTGERCALFGHSAGQNNTGERSTIFGDRAGRDNEGERLTAFGYDCGRGNKGDDCILIGDRPVPDNEINNRFMVRAALAGAAILDGDLSTGGIAMGAPQTADKLADDRLAQNRMTFYLDESTNKLHVRVKYSDTSIKEGEVDLL